MRILIFGDSITQGFWDSEGGWVQRIRKEYDLHKIDNIQEDLPTIFNLGVSGDSSDEIVQRFEAETKARIEDELIIIFATGVNDSRIRDTKEFSNTERYKQNLVTLYNQASKYTNKILFVGLTPCVEERTNPVAWNTTRYQNGRIEQFDKALQEFCEQQNVAFIDILKPFSEAQDKTELLPDGVHPNDEGHKLIATLVKSILDQSISSTI